MFWEKSIYYWIARLEGGSAVITDTYRDERRLLCVEADREENLEMFRGGREEVDECEDNPLKVHVVCRQPCLKSCPPPLLFLVTD